MCRRTERAPWSRADRGRRGRRRVVAAALVVAPLLAALLPWAAPAVRPAAAQDDPVATYLESLELRTLLTTRLEQLVAEADPETRPRLLERLAGLYAELLDAAETPEDRTRLLARAAEVVRAAGRERTEALELAIARADYRGAERTAERWRVRAIDADALEAARATLAEVAATLDDLADRVRGTLERSRSAANRATGRRALEVADALDEALRLQGEIDYLAGWTAYYRGWLGDPRAGLADAAERFERLLELGDRGAIPAAVDPALLGGEGFARAVLGMGLVRGLGGRAEETMRWFGLLEAEDVHPRVRAELPGWRLAVLADAGAWRRIRDELELLADREDVPADWLRLVAVRGLEAEGDRIAGLAARTAVAELGRRGELAVLYAIAERHGIEGLGERGFLVRYVQAASDFSRAAETHGRRVGADGAARQAWQEVARGLETALAAPDADEAGGTAADAERLLGWAWWYAGDAESAWPRFAGAAERLPTTAAAEASWMAIVALDQLVLAGRGEMREEVGRRIDAFLERFPGHERAPALRARRIAARPDAAAEQDLEALLAVPPGHPRWRSSRETVAAVLARRFRAGGEDAVEAGRRYLEVAEALLEASDEASDEAAGAGAAAGDAGGPGRAEVDAARLSLEIALDPRIGERAAAGRMLARIERWRAGGWDPGAAADELRYRRIQWALAGARWTEAAERAAAFARSGPFASAWSRAGLARVLDAAVGRGAPRSRVDAAWALAEPVLEAGGAAAVRPADGLRLVVLAGEAGLRRGDLAADDAALEAVADAMERARRIHPGERGVLRLLGLAAGRLGRDALALDCWRTLSDGLSPSSPEWYEARFELLTVLTRVDAARALRVVRQHAALEPEYGPAPWGPRLRALHERLERDLGDGGDGGADGDEDGRDGRGDGRGDDEHDGSGGGP